jgi:nucleoside phosphorylase
VAARPGDAGKALSPAMAVGALAAPGLLAHVFLTPGSPGAEAGSEPLRSLWATITRGFSLDHGIPLLGVPQYPPRELPIFPGEFALLAAAESGARSIWQACAWADRGVVGVTVMMAPPRERDCRDAWASLERSWEEAVAAFPPDGILGESRVFLALLARGAEGEASGEPATPGQALDLVRAAAPGPTALGWWQRGDVVPLTPPDGEPGEVVTWEIGPDRHDGRRARRLVALASAESERQTDDFLWTSGDGALSPLARHLMHAARLRHQIRVFGDGKVPRQLRGELGALVDALPGDLASRQLSEACVSGIKLRRRLDAMRHAVGIVSDNLHLAVDLPQSPSSAGPLSDDRQLATWFQRRLDDEVTLLDKAVQSAQSARTFLADDAVPVHPAGPGGPGVRRGALLADAGGSRDAAAQDPWVVVFTALGVEYQAIRAYLDPSVKRHEVHGTVYEAGRLSGVHGSWRVALAETGPGSTAAGVQLDRAIGVFAPEIAIFLGVAGGRKDVALGDVVAADAIYDYEWGKSTLKGFQPRIRVHYPAYRLQQWARLVARENQWQRRIRPSQPGSRPRSFVKPIATGGKVIAHDRSQVALLLNRYAGDALAVETEGHGFLEAAYVNPDVDALVIRGISDLMTGKDALSDDYWQPVASGHAAAFAIELLDSIGLNRT